jgi:hypothetical protein
MKRGSRAIMVVKMMRRSVRNFDAAVQTSAHAIVGCGVAQALDDGVRTCLHCACVAYFY